MRVMSYSVSAHWTLSGSFFTSGVRQCFASPMLESRPAP